MKWKHPRGVTVVQLSPLTKGHSSTSKPLVQLSPSGSGTTPLASSGHTQSLALHDILLCGFPPPCSFPSSFKIVLLLKRHPVTECLMRTLSDTGFSTRN